MGTKGVSVGVGLRVAVGGSVAVGVEVALGLGLDVCEAVGSTVIGPLAQPIIVNTINTLSVDMVIIRDIRAR